VIIFIIFFFFNCRGHGDNSRSKYCFCNHSGSCT